MSDFNFDDELLRRREEKLSKDSYDLIDLLAAILFAPDNQWRERAQLVVGHYSHLNQSLVDIDRIEEECGSRIGIHELHFSETEELNYRLPPGLLVPEGGARLFRKGFHFGAHPLDHPVFTEFVRGDEEALVRDLKEQLRRPPKAWAALAAQVSPGKIVWGKARGPNSAEVLPGVFGNVDPPGPESGWNTYEIETIPRGDRGSSDGTLELSPYPGTRKAGFLALDGEVFRGAVCQDLFIDAVDLLHSFKDDKEELEGWLGELQADKDAADARAEALLEAKREQGQEIHSLHSRLQSLLKKGGRTLARGEVSRADHLVQAIQRKLAELDPDCRTVVKVLPSFVADLGRHAGLPEDGVVLCCARACARGKPEHKRPIEEHEILEGGRRRGAQIVRAGDGARAFRAYLEKNTPAAKRIHYWLRSGEDGSPVIEFANVVLHDDCRIDGA